MKHVGIKAAPASTDPRKNQADVLAELRNVVGHGKRLDPTTVQPWAADHLFDDHLDVTVRDVVRDVIEQLALRGASASADGASSASSSG